MPNDGAFPPEKTKENEAEGAYPNIGIKDVVPISA
jgi:hypothetical protein